MTPLELRVIVYAIVAVLAFGSVAWGVHTLDAHHYERIAQVDKLAQDQALEQAQRNVIAAQAAQHAAESKAESEHEILVKADTTSRDAALGSVRSLEAALHLIRLPTAVGNPGAVPGASPVAGGDPRIAGLVDRLNASIERAIGACQHDAGNLAYILSIEPPVIP